MTETPDHRYPIGTVRALLDSEHVTAPTRAALQARLAGSVEVRPHVLGNCMELLAAVCTRLIPQTGEPQVDVAEMLCAADERHR